MQPSAPSSVVDPIYEIQRLRGDLAHFDRDIVQLEARCAARPRPWDRIRLVAARTARSTTLQALEAWLRLETTPEKDRPLVH